MKILIADDEALSRRLLEKTLDRAGYEVIAVENGKQALEQLCKPNGPRLALLDWIMPETGRARRVPRGSYTHGAALRLYGATDLEGVQRRNRARPGIWSRRLSD